MSELAQRNYATAEDVHNTFTTMFDSATEEFDDQRKQIRLIVDRTNVESDEFDEKAKVATDKIDAASADLQKRQQDVVDHFQLQSTENSQLDAKLADFDQKIAAADLSFQEPSQAYESLVEHAKTAFAENRRELQEIYRRVSESGAAGGGGPSTGGTARERNVFDPRDYKLPELSEKASVAALRKWRHEVDVFTETIGPSWAGVGSLLASSRMLALEFTSSQLTEVIRLVKQVNHGQSQVKDWEFDFATKSDIFYKLLMPKLPLELATDLRQVGTSKGFERYRRVVRKIDPPKENDAFHMGNEIRGLG